MDTLGIQVGTWCNRAVRLGISESAFVRHGSVAEFLSAHADVPERLILAPSRRAGDDFVRDQVVALGGLMGVHRSTLVHLATDLSSVVLAQTGRARLSRLGVEAAAARAIHHAKQQGHIRYFAPVEDMPGFPRAVAKTLEELRLEGIISDALPHTGPAGQDLARLLEVYEAQLEAGQLADRATVLEAATTAIEDHAPRLTGLPVALIDIAPRCAKEASLLGALLDAAPEAYAVLPAADTQGIAAWEDLGATPERLETEGELDSLERTRRFVFSAEAPEYRPLDNSVGFFSAPGEALECVEITRRLLHFAQAGLPYDRAAILLRTPETYQPLMEDALQRAGIPGFFTHGTRRPDPAGRALLALLACAAEGLSASRFAEYLSLGQVPERDEDGAPPTRKVAWIPSKDDGQLVFSTLIAPPTLAPPPEDDGPRLEGHLEVPLQWERLLVDAAVIGGEARWSRRLRGLSRELRLHIEALHDAPAQQAQRRRALAALQNLERFALPVIRFLSDLPRQATWHHWLDRLTELVGLTLNDTEGVLSTLSELRPMGEVGPIGLEEVQLVLTERLSFLRQEPTTDRFGRVFVGTLEEASGRVFEVVFIPGLAEGIFPKKALEDPLLLDEARQQIREDLQVRRKKFQEERRLLHLGLGAAKRRVVLSYPRMDVVQGRPRVPSFYALDLLRAAEGRLPELKSLEKRAAQAADARLGWPAPRRPEDAVDESEYDLAVLGPLVFEAPDRIRGLGRYLIEGDEGRPPNPYLVRNLRTQAGRWRARFGRNDGLFASMSGSNTDAIQLALADHRLDARSFSPTALQRFAQCPYQFLLSAIYRLRPREQAARIETLDPLTRGRLFHTTQFQLFITLNEQNLFPIRDDRLDTILPIADKVLSQVATRYAEQLAPAIEEVWQKEIESLRLDLRRWLRDLAQDGGTFRPIRSELAFGLAYDPDQERDPHSIDAPVPILEEHYLMRGSIDWVEEHVDTHSLRVIDHKTGRFPQAPPVYVGRGEYLQPLVYGLVAEAMFERPVTEALLSYCTHKGQFQTVRIPIDQSGKDRLLQVLMTIDDAIAQGTLLAIPRQGACRYCDYASVCGPSEERRMDFKQPDQQPALVALRRSP